MHNPIKQPTISKSLLSTDFKRNDAKVFNGSNKGFALVVVQKKKEKKYKHWVNEDIVKEALDFC
jgi:hypothetical protein